MREISEKRLLILTAAVLLLLLAGSLSFGNWRITLGVLLGGGLAVLNLWWLKISIKSLLAKAAGGGVQANFNLSLYVLRYVFIAGIVVAAVMLNLVTVAATLLGLLSFAFAILIESIIQIYFIILNREEN